MGITYQKNLRNEWWRGFRSGLAHGVFVGIAAMVLGYWAASAVIAYLL